MTTVRLFKPRSHERKREATPARNGAPLPGRTPSFLLAPSIGVFGFVPVKMTPFSLIPNVCGHV